MSRVRAEGVDRRGDIAARPGCLNISHLEPLNKDNNDRCGNACGRSNRVDIYF